MDGCCILSESCCEVAERAYSSLHVTLQKKLGSPSLRTMRAMLLLLPH